jgi:hypothetical protein
MPVANPYGYPSWMLTPRAQASVRACTRILKAWGVRSADRHAWSWVYDGSSAGDLLRIRRTRGPGFPKSSKIGPFVYGGGRRTRRWLSTRSDPTRKPRKPSKRHELEFAGYKFTSGPSGTTIHRSSINTRAPGDYGADPLGDGRFRMVPSGDIVDFEERNRRLAKKDPRRSRPRRRDVGGGSPHGMLAGHSYHSALTAARAEAKKCRTPWYIKQFGASWYMTDTHPTIPYVKVHVDERAIKHMAGDPRRRRSRKRARSRR